MTVTPAEFFDEWAQEAFAEHPTLAASLGLTAYDGQLGDFSEEAFDRRRRSAHQWARRLHELGWAAAAPDRSGRPGLSGSAHEVGPGAPELSPEDRVDAKLLASHLAGEAVMDDWEAWRRDPDVYLQPCLEGIFSIFLHRLRPEPELVEAVVAMLRQVPGVVACARRQLDLDRANGLILQRARATAVGGAQFFVESLPHEVAAGPLREALATAGLQAAEALEGFALFLDEAGPKAKGSYAIGEERYSALLQKRELLSFDAGQLRAVGERAYAALDSEMTEVARRTQPQAEGWREVVQQMSARHPATAEELVQGYSDACQKAREFLLERSLVTMPEGEHCSVEPSPEFLRAVIAVASYQQPPAFAAGGHGHFFVPFPPKGATDEAVDQLLSNNSWASIPTIAVHEAYPGHHWQLTWARQSDRPIRHIIDSAYFIEGWALYAEAMMRRQGFFREPEHELAHLDARIFRAARIVVDTSLHGGDMTVDQAVTYMQERASLSPTVAVAEVGRYCAWPTQAASYLTGALELDHMAQRWADEGRGTLCEFHDAVAASPGLPLALAGEQLFG